MSGQLEFYAVGRRTHRPDILGRHRHGFSTWPVARSWTVLGLKHIVCFVFFLSVTALSDGGGLLENSRLEWW